MDCVFCKIASGEIPAKKAFESDKVLAFYDLDPQAPVHILVIPKEHIPSAADISSENSGLVAAVFETVARLAAERNLSEGFRVVTNSGISAGQSVGHLHFHLLGGKGFHLAAGMTGIS